MLSKKINTAQTTAQTTAQIVIENPNTHPGEYIRKGKNEQIFLYILLDVSMSQRVSGPYLIYHLKLIAEKYPNAKIYCFGMRGYNKYNMQNKWILLTQFIQQIKEMREDHWKIWDTYTYTEHIKIAFQEIAKSHDKKTLWFIGDGDFNGDFKDDNFGNIIRTSNLSTITDLKLLLSPHTKQWIENDLHMKIREILQENVNQVTYNCFTLTHYGNKCLSEQQLGQGMIIPEKYFGFNGWIIHNDIISQIMAEYFLQHFPEEILEFVKVLKETIQKNPALLVGTKDNAYKKIDNMVRFLKDHIFADGTTIQKIYISWLSTHYDNITNPTDKNHVKELMESRFNDSTMERYICQMLRQDMIGLITVSDKLKLWAQSEEGEKLIKDAIKDQSGATFIRLFQQIYSGIIWLPGKSEDNGMIIPAITKVDSKIIYYSLQTFLYGLTKNKTTISGFIINLLCMCILTLDIEIPSILRIICEKHMTQGEEFLYNMIGKKTDTGTFVIHDV